MRISALLGLLFLLVGCASAQPKPATFVPPPLPFRLEVMPKIIQVQSDYWLACSFPVDVGEGYYLMGIPGESISGGPIESIQKRMYMHSGCEPVQAFCSYTE